MLGIDDGILVAAFYILARALYDILGMFIHGGRVKK